MPVEAWTSTVLVSTPHFPRTLVVTRSSPDSPGLSTHGLAGRLATLHPHEVCTLVIVTATADVLVTE